MHLPSRHTLLRTALLPLLFIALAHAQDNNQKPALVQLASVFSDHMVIQRDQAITVWGRASADVNVTVVLGEHQRNATAQNGHFTVELPALPANAKAAELVVRAQLGAREQTITLHDVLVGDLWLCTGQSNMRWRVNQSTIAPRRQPVSRPVSEPVTRAFRTSPTP